MSETLSYQIECVVAELEVAAAQGRVNVLLARMAGGVAGLLDRHDMVSRLKTVISGLTMADLLGGAITNIHPDTIDANRVLELSSPEEAARRHPPCDDESIFDALKAQGSPHVQLCLQGNVERAAQLASSTLELEDIGCTLVALGQFDRATAFIDGQAVSDIAKSQVRFVILLEKCRRELPGFADAIKGARLQGYERLHIILALAGRLPWTGYPYSDS